MQLFYFTIAVVVLYRDTRMLQEKSKIQEVFFAGSEYAWSEESFTHALEVLWETLLSVPLCHWTGL